MRRSKVTRFAAVLVLLAGLVLAGPAQASIIGAAPGGSVGAWGLDWSWFSALWARTIGLAGGGASFHHAKAASSGDAGGTVTGDPTAGGGGQAVPAGKSTINPDGAT